VLGNIPLKLISGEIDSQADSFIFLLDASGIIPSFSIAKFD